MEFKIKVQTLEDGYYAASVVKNEEQQSSIGGVVYSHSAGEAYEILRKRLESKGHKVID